MLVALNSKYFQSLGKVWNINSWMLSLKGMTIRKLPSSLRCLARLAFLNLKDCKSLVCLPDTIHGLHSLSILDISGCSKLCRFPEGLKEIKCLKELHANETAVENYLHLSSI